MLRNHSQSVDVFKLRSYMIEETSTTPFVGISVIDNSLLIQGQIFLSQRVPVFRTNTLEVLDKFYSHGNMLRKIRIDLDTMEQGSFGWIYDLLEKIFVEHRSEDAVEIIWYYKRECLDCLHQGHKISSRMGVPMTFISKD